MSHNTSILYSGFYDVPVAFVAWYVEKQFLFLRHFDEELDDYPSFYRVFTLPRLTDEEIQNSWSQLETLADEFIGEIPVAELRFDSTKRKAITAESLKRLINKITQQVWKLETRT